MENNKKSNQKPKEETKKQEEKKVSIFDKMKKVVTKSVDCCKE